MEDQILLGLFLISPLLLLLLLSLLHQFLPRLLRSFLLRLLRFLLRTCSSASEVIRRGAERWRDAGTPIPTRNGQTGPKQPRINLTALNDIPLIPRWWRCRRLTAPPLRLSWSQRPPSLPLQYPSENLFTIALVSTSEYKYKTRA